MKHTLLVGFLLATLLTACSAVPTPQPTATLTPVPSATETTSPTETASPPPTATSTETPEPTRAASATKPPKPTKTPKPKLFIGCFTPNGIKGPTAPFKIEARTNKKVVVYINGISRNGNHPIYCTEIVKQGLPKLLTLMWGDYTYMVQIGDRITKRGTFFVNDSDKATMQVFEDKIRIGPFP